MRYLVLAGVSYYPAACDDIVGVFDDMRTATLAADAALGVYVEYQGTTEWAQVYDLVEQELVYKVGKGFGVRGIEYDN